MLEIAYCNHLVRGHHVFNFSLLVIGNEVFEIEHGACVAWRVCAREILANRGRTQHLL